MGKKIAVYAICKNEEKFVRRFLESMKEADEVTVLDTGSEDGTVEILKALGARVFRETVSPWRFDKARNRALSYVSENMDICVSADLDEYFLPGWRKNLENAWTDKTRRALFKYIWSFGENGAEGTVLTLDKIHARHGYIWKYPVHEAVFPEDGKRENAEECVYAEGVVLCHAPDPQKSRAQYLPLLETAVLENPADARCLHYLGREYMYKGMWEKCIQTLQAHLLLPGSLWKEERSASCRYMARAYRALGNSNQAECMYYAAISQAPELREAYFELCGLFIKEGKITGAKFMAECALKIEKRPASYMSEESAWNKEAEAFLKGVLSL